MRALETGLYEWKGSKTHKAAVVGDPMKAVAGPTPIIYMKLVGLTALLLLPLLVK